MPEAQWKGYIKDYNGSTMMQCKIVRDIDYINISETLKKQRDAIIAKIFQMSNMRIYQGLRFDVGREYSFDEIPGLKEAGWTVKSYDLAKEGEEKTFEQ